MTLVPSDRRILSGLAISIGISTPMQVRTRKPICVDVRLLSNPAARTCTYVGAVPD